ncbi:MAG: cytochrome C biogenesis protein [Rhizobiales bacterium PAR1]|nr:MAG: cytochrome C biogenesis protein [Rhizobiales bacterium PAR1]
MTIGTLALAFLAGLLTVLSPCVLPLLPIVLGAATTRHRFGPFALAAGLTLSFTLIGLFVALVGFSIGLDGDVFRSVAAVLLLVVGLVLVLPALQDRVALLVAPISDWFNARFGGFAASGLSGQFLLGILLGAIWSPCVGPTLGAASILASQGKSLMSVGATMLAFGIGASLPLIALGLASREMIQRWRPSLGSGGSMLKKVLGSILVVVGLLILTGLDKRVETFLVDLSPEWLTTLTTRF